MKVEELLRPHFRGIPEDRFQKALVIVSKKIKPSKRSRQEFKNTGIYNAVALNRIPYKVIEVKDADKAKMTWWIMGQQVVCSRNLEPPVIVEYVAEADDTRWLDELLAAMRLAVKEK